MLKADSFIAHATYVNQQPNMLVLNLRKNIFKAYLVDIYSNILQSIITIKVYRKNIKASVKEEKSSKLLSKIWLKTVKYIIIDIIR